MRVEGTTDYFEVIWKCMVSETMNAFDKDT